MGNVIVVAVLAILALACEIWLRKPRPERVSRRFAKGQLRY
jgi:hypothetical protein